MATLLTNDIDAESTTPPDGTVLTLDEFLALPDAPRAELEDGVFEVVPPAGGPHGAVNARLLARLTFHVLEHRLGVTYDSSTAFVLRAKPPLVRSPDVSFVRRHRINPTIKPGSPDIAAETLSPSERAGKIQKKVEEYLEHGTELVWLIDPQHRTATVYTRGGGVRWLHEGDALDGGDVVPGFSVPLAFLFEDLAPLD